jgi:hypothetical protein
MTPETTPQIVTGPRQGRGSQRREIFAAPLVFERKAVTSLRSVPAVQDAGAPSGRQLWNPKRIGVTANAPRVGALNVLPTNCQTICHETVQHFVSGLNRAQFNLRSAVRQGSITRSTHAEDTLKTRSRACVERLLGVWRARCGTTDRRKGTA